MCTSDVLCEVCPQLDHVERENIYEFPLRLLADNVCGPDGLLIE